MAAYLGETVHFAERYVYRAVHQGVYVTQELLELVIDRIDFFIRLYGVLYARLHAVIGKIALPFEVFGREAAIDEIIEKFAGNA